MKAAVIHKFSGIENIRFESIRERVPESHELSIAIQCAGINPVDWKVAEGFKKDRMDYQMPITLGWECSGVVKDVGNKVEGFKEGDRVCTLYRSPILHEGTYAETITLDSSMVAHLPEEISFEQGACFPLAASTAWQALQRLHAPLTKILILGGNGGVGNFAIQLAKILGAEVYTTAQSQNHDYLKGLGADHCIDYRESTAIESLGSFPAVIDCVGVEGLNPIYSHIAPEGCVISIATFPDPSKLEKIRAKGEFFIVESDREFLDKFLLWAKEGSVQFPEIATYEFTHLIEALRENRARHVRGKAVLKVR
jgi:NADPH:quinone reductase-like Zn-dependent oxidoreductase